MQPAKSQTKTEVQTKPVMGRPSIRTEVQDKLYFEARANFCSKLKASVIAGYNYATIVNHWSKEEAWIAAEAEAMQCRLDEAEDVVFEDMRRNPDRAAKYLAKHRKEEHGNEAIEVKHEHVIDVEPAMASLYKSFGISQGRSADRGEGRPEGAIIEGHATALGEVGPPNLAGLIEDLGSDRQGEPASPPDAAGE